MFKELNDGHSFRFEHCWEILKKNPKWCFDQLTKTGGSKKQKSVEGNSIDTEPPSTPTTPGSVFSIGDDSINQETFANQSINSDGKVRPLGRKNSKEKKKRVIEEKGMIDALGNLQCTLEKQFNFNQQEVEKKETRRIMNCEKKP